MSLEDLFMRNMIHPYDQQLLRNAAASGVCNENIDLIINRNMIQPEDAMLLRNWCRLIHVPAFLLERLIDRYEEMQQPPKRQRISPPITSATQVQASAQPPQQQPLQPPAQP